MTLKKMTLWGRDENDEHLVDEVIRGEKTATCTPKAWYYDDPEELPTDPGDRVALFNLRGQQRCTIEIVDVVEMRFGDVDERTVIGEHCATREQFWAAHRLCWEAELTAQGQPLSDDTVMVVEHFRLVSVEER